MAAPYHTPARFMGAALLNQELGLPAVQVRLHIAPEGHG
jgi:hypothetical protein